MTAIDAHLFPCCSVPNLYRAIVACRCYTFAIWRPCYGLYSIPMAAIGNDAKTVSGIPYTYRFVEAGSSNVRPCGRPYYCCHATGVSATDITCRLLRLWSWRIGSLQDLRFGRRLVTVRESRLQGICLADQLLRGN